MTPAPRKQSPSSPATSRHRPGGPATSVNTAVAARVRQLAAQAEHRRAIADYQARHAADQQARVDALLLEAISALAGLLGTPGPHPSLTRPPPRSTHSQACRPIASKTCRNVHTERCQVMCKQRGR
jgi:hypothetical protein